MSRNNQPDPGVRGVGRVAADPGVWGVFAVGLGASQLGGERRGVPIESSESVRCPPRRVLLVVVVVQVVAPARRRRLFCWLTNALKRAGGSPNRRALLNALVRAIPSDSNEGMAPTAPEGGADVCHGGAMQS